MSKKINHLGMKYGHLTGVRYTGTSRNCASVWLWRCDCGNEKEIEARVVTGGRTKSCGNCEYKHKLISDANRGKISPNKKVLKEFRSNVQRAAKKGIKWQLNVYEFRDLVTSPCTLCGTPPPSNGFNKIELLSIDKVYTVGGCYTRCQGCSSAFGKTSLSLLITRIIEVFKHLHANK